MFYLPLHCDDKLRYPSLMFSFSNVHIIIFSLEMLFCSNGYALLSGKF